MERYISYVAVKGNYRLGLGCVGSTPAIFAITPNGEGIKYYNSWFDACDTFDEIVEKAKLTIAKKV